jgi:hypothetical protein
MAPAAVSLQVIFSRTTGRTDGRTEDGRRRRDGRRDGRTDRGRRRRRRWDGRRDTTGRTENISNIYQKVNRRFTPQKQARTDVSGLAIKSVNRCASFCKSTNIFYFVMYLIYIHILFIYFFYLYTYMYIYIYIYIFIEIRYTIYDI